MSSTNLANDSCTQNTTSGLINCTFGYSNPSSQSTTIYRAPRPFYYPFSKPIVGSLADLCANPTSSSYACTTVANGSSCGTGLKPVIDCGISNNNIVCCPETSFPYSQITDYCSYLRNQDCIYSTSQTSCPTGIFVSDCSLCCPLSVTSNLNFSDNFNLTEYNIIGSQWNKNFANLEDGVYEIGYTAGGTQSSCIIDANGTLTLYNPAVGDAGSCGSTWKITNYSEWYSGSGIYPGTDTSYQPGGFTIQNQITGNYLSIQTNQFGPGITLSLNQTPTVVAIYTNADGSYRITNAKNPLQTTTSIGNIGNSQNCLVINANNSISTYNWGSGEIGLPCGINNQTDQVNYKFTITQSQNAQSTNIPVTLANGEYFIEIIDSSFTTPGSSGNHCLTDQSANSWNLNPETNAEVSTNVSSYNWGQSGWCGGGPVNQGNSISAIWIVVQNPAGGYTIQNKASSKYLQSPSFNTTEVTSSTPNQIYIYKNSDGTVRITGPTGICLNNNQGNFQGYNWNVSSGECGTGVGSNITSNYKFNISPVPPITYKPVAKIPNGTYLINNITDNSTIMDSGNSTSTSTSIIGIILGTLQIPDNTVVNTNTINQATTPLLPNSNKWIINNITDPEGNAAYTIQNAQTNNYLGLYGNDALSNTPGLGSNCIGCISLTTSPTPTTLYIYQNADGTTYHIQDSQGVCFIRGLSTFAIQADVTFEPYFWSNGNSDCGTATTDNISNYKFTFTGPPENLPVPQLTGNGGTCNFLWYNADGTSQTVSGFSDMDTCNAALAAATTTAQTNSPGSPTNGVWTPFFPAGNTAATVIYDYGQTCLAIESNTSGAKVIASTNCTMPGSPPGIVNNCDQNTGICTQSTYPPVPVTTSNWIISNDAVTGKYTIQNQINNEYLVIPESASDTNLYTSPNKTLVDISLTYSSFGPITSGVYPSTEYYMRFTNPNSAKEICAYSDNINAESITWSSNVGPVSNETYISGLTTAPVQQQQLQVYWECGTDPSKISDLNPTYGTPNTNYQFTVSNFCVTDINFNNLCFTDYGQVVS